MKRIDEGKAMDSRRCSAGYAGLESSGRQKMPGCNGMLDSSMVRILFSWILFIDYLFGNNYNGT